MSKEGYVGGTEINKTIKALLLKNIAKIFNYK
jgi:hypothetical protein